MKQIIDRNYGSIKKRGLITPKTSHIDFMHKLNEEVQEVKNELIKPEVNKVKLFFELADVILVCLNWIWHYKHNPQEYLEKKIVINENR